MSLRQISVLRKATTNLKQSEMKWPSFKRKNKDLTDNDPAKIKAAIHQREIVFFVFKQPLPRHTLSF